MTLVARWISHSLFALSGTFVQVASSADEQPLAFSASSNPSTPWAAAALEYQVDVIELYAIAFQESRRRREHGVMRPWPWTLNSPATGAIYFETYEQALAKLLELIKAGERNIDVGMMGINWGWNGHRAKDAAHLLELNVNIQVAAEIYREHLNAQQGDPRRAIARYHSGRQELGDVYAASVMTIADQLRRLPGIAQVLLQ